VGRLIDPEEALLEERRIGALPIVNAFMERLGLKELGFPRSAGQFPRQDQENDPWVRVGSRQRGGIHRSSTRGLRVRSAIRRSHLQPSRSFCSCAITSAVVAGRGLNRGVAQ